MATASLPVNWWRDDKCAKAFWSQQELPPYRELLDATAAWLRPEQAERWLDLGCGGGRLTRALWEASGGTVAEVVGMDCAAINAQAYQRLRETLQPPPGERVRFVRGDFGGGLPWAEDASLDGVVSGLALQYAEAYNETEQRWTTDSYDRVLAEVLRVLRPGGRFVFSVNVPEPAWGRVAVDAIRGVWTTPKKLRYLQKAWRMWRYGGWLTREARAGRFHYLPLSVVLGKLEAVGFRDVEHRLSYAGQAYLFRCRKP
jgi:SAM-dependent methyltransferase